MNFKIEQQIGARFKLVKHKGNPDKSHYESGWSNNLVLDSGLNRMSVGTWIDRLSVGSGSSAPIPSQTGLDNRIATTIDRQDWQPILNTTEDPIWYGIRMRYRFAEGVAAGNLSEVGLGWADNSMWNRALIRDQDGTPVTVTVLSDEFLDVITEIKVYPLMNFNGAFTLRNKDGQPISSHTYLGRTILPDSSRITPNFSRVEFTGNWSSKPMQISPNQLTAGYSDNGGSGIYHSRNGQTSTWPTTTSHRQTISLYLDTNNYSHRSMSVYLWGLIVDSYPNIGYKWEIDPPITKTNLNTMTYSYEISWSRYTGA